MGQVRTGAGTGQVETLHRFKNIIQSIHNYILNHQNQLLKSERNVSFEEVVFHIEKKHVLDIVEHPNQEKYSGQKIFIVNINDYAYLVPFVENDQEIFLKTIIPSRKATKKYLRGQGEDE